MYVKHCKLSKYKQEKLLEFFTAGITARTAAELCNVHRNTQHYKRVVCRTWLYIDRTKNTKGDFLSSSTKTRTLVYYWYMILK